MVGGPPERGAQVGQLGAEPVVGLSLTGAVPQGHDVGFAPGEVAGMGGPRLGGLAACDELFLGELADRLQHRKPGPPGDRSATSSDLRTKASSRSRRRSRRRHRSGHRARALEVDSAREHRTPTPAMPFRRRRGGRRTRSRRGAVCGGVPVRAVSRPAAGNGDRDDHAPRWGHRRHPRGCQLNGQGYPIETLANLDDSGGFIAVDHRKARRNTLSAFNEQAHRRRVDSRCRVQRGDRPHLLLGDPESFSAGGQDFHGRGLREGWPR